MRGLPTVLGIGYPLHQFLAAFLHDAAARHLTVFGFEVDADPCASKLLRDKGDCAAANEGVEDDAASESYTATAVTPTNRLILSCCRFGF